jgi:hypothetical protein
MKRRLIYRRLLPAAALVVALACTGLGIRYIVRDRAVLRLAKPGMARAELEAVLGPPEKVVDFNDMAGHYLAYYRLPEEYADENRELCVWFTKSGWIRARGVLPKGEHVGFHKLEDEILPMDSPITTLRMWLWMQWGVRL